MPEARVSFGARRGRFGEAMAERARFTRPQVLGAALLGAIVALLVLLSRLAS